MHKYGTTRERERDREKAENATKLGQLVSKTHTTKLSLKPKPTAIHALMSNFERAVVLATFCKGSSSIVGSSTLTPITAAMAPSCFDIGFIISCTTSMVGSLPKA